MKKVRIGFIGAGGMANKVHYPSLAEMDDVEIAGICDLNTKRLNETADKYGVEMRFTNYLEMIEKINLDAVYIIMPPHLLHDLVIECLKKRVNVFIEKPPGISLVQIEAMARLAEKNGCKTMVAFNRRYIPLLRKVKEIVEEKGKIIQAVATFYKNIKVSLSYHTKPIDILREDAIHCVDTLRWMGGEVKKVTSLVRKYHAEVYNSFHSLIEFENGATGILHANWAVGKRVHTFEMHAKGISSFINAPTEPSENKAIIYADDKREGKIISGTEVAGSDDFYKFYGYYQENRHFIDCIKEDREPETSFSDAVKTMELIEKIYQSSM